MKFYNSLTRKIEEFEPIDQKRKKVGVYTCGPTVYDYVSIGNWRTYTLGDLVVRTLNYLGYDVDYVMNITDVGHLTGDNLGDADTGEDRMEKGARREGKTAWDIAEFYAKDFFESYEKLNLVKPKMFCKATDHIKEQIQLIKEIEKHGYTYKIDDGIYFNTKKYEADGNTYGKLSTLDQIKVGARVEPVPDKKDPRDFALWKFSPDSPVGERRHMEWDSPWGVGFPGWHIECSAMSIKYLGEQFDIHIGGEDLRSTHHPNEIAQAEAATGKKPFVKYWLHGAFLKVDGGRMGKSLGNAYTLQDVEKKDFEPMHLRYFYLTAHYRQPLNFTWKNLEKAKESYERLVNLLLSQTLSSGDSGSRVTKDWEERFRQALEDDLNMPKVLAVIWEMVRSDIEDEQKQRLLLQWDQVLGLGIEARIKKQELREYSGERSGATIISDTPLSGPTIAQVDSREIARLEENWQEADKKRQEIEAKGFIIKDTSSGPQVKKKK